MSVGSSVLRIMDEKKNREKKTEVEKSIGS